MRKKVCLILGMCCAVNILIPMYSRNVISGGTDKESFGTYEYKEDYGISENFGYDISTQEEPSDKTVDFTG